MAGKVPTFKEGVINPLVDYSKGKLNLYREESFSYVEAEQLKGSVYVHITHDADKNATISVVEDVKQNSFLGSIAGSVQSTAKGSIGEQLKAAKAEDLVLFADAVAKIKEAVNKYNDTVIKADTTYLLWTPDAAKVYPSEMKAIEILEKAVEARLEKGVKAKGEAGLKKADAEAKAQAKFDETKAKIEEQKAQKKAPKDADGKALSGSAKLKARRAAHKEIVKLLKEQKSTAEGLSDSKEAKKAVKKDLKHEYKNEKSRLERIRTKRDEKGKDITQVDSQIVKAEAGIEKYARKKRAKDSSESSTGSDE